MIEIKAVGLNDLLRLEHDLCKSSLRPSLWLDDDEVEVRGTAAALGRLVKRTLESRGLLGNEFELNQSDLALALGKPVTRLNEFLNGRPTGKVWSRFARKAVTVVLSGTETITTQQLEVINRILRYFFPRGDVELQSDVHSAHEKWYFAESLRRSVHPESPLEVEAELRGLAFAARNYGLSGRIIRVSGRDRFRQVNDALTTLTETGERTLECLEAGIEVIYVYPECSENEALRASKASAIAFRELAKRRLGDSDSFRRLSLHALQPWKATVSNGDNASATRFAGEYLTPMLRWQYYELSDGRSCLIVSRWRSSYGPSVFAPDEHEVRDFRDWVSAFVDPRA